MAIDKDVLDQLLAGRDPQELFAKDGLLDELKKALSERMLSAELDDHLESEGAEGAINRRNGSSRKTMLTGTSKVTLDVPRDRAGTFDPHRVAPRTSPDRPQCATSGEALANGINAHPDFLACDSRRFLGTGKRHVRMAAQAHVAALACNCGPQHP